MKKIIIAIVCVVSFVTFTSCKKKSFECHTYTIDTTGQIIVGGLKNKKNFKDVEERASYELKNNVTCFEMP